MAPFVPVPRSISPDPSKSDAWIERISAEDAEGKLAEAYERISHFFNDTATTEIYTLHPQSLLDHHALYRTSMFGPSPLTRVERESIAVVVSAANDCFY
jgi:alkylhydroperoxidase family enzyme